MPFARFVNRRYTDDAGSPHAPTRFRLARCNGTRREWTAPWRLLGKEPLGGRSAPHPYLSRSHPPASICAARATGNGSAATPAACSRARGSSATRAGGPRAGSALCARAHRLHNPHTGDHRRVCPHYGANLSRPGFSKKSSRGASRFLRSAPRRGEQRETPNLSRSSLMSLERSSAFPLSPSPRSSLARLSLPRRRAIPSRAFCASTESRP